LNNYLEQRQRNAYYDWVMQEQEDAIREQQVQSGWVRYMQQILDIATNIPDPTPKPIISEVYSIGSFFNKVYN
tara:strand:+ start:3251 stop:3469 length:219 start_codon:yes stop_codon:yes gene_type:complete